MVTTVDLTPIEETLPSHLKAPFRFRCRNWLRNELGLGGNHYWENDWQTSIYYFEYPEDALVFKIKFLGYR